MVDSGTVHGAEYDPDGDVQWFHSLAEPELTQDQFLTLLFLRIRSSWLETPLRKQLGLPGSSLLSMIVVCCLLLTLLIFHAICYAWEHTIQMSVELPSHQ